jgi:hypothetical protein
MCNFARAAKATCATFPETRCDQRGINEATEPFLPTHIATNAATASIVSRVIRNSDFLEEPTTRYSETAVKEILYAGRSVEVFV